MKANEPVVQVKSKVTGIPREFTLTQWQNLPKISRLEWEQITPEEVLKGAPDNAVIAPPAAGLPKSQEQQIADGVAEALKRLGLTPQGFETEAQKQERLVKEGVAAELRKMGLPEEKIKAIQEGQKITDVPVETADADKVKTVAEAAKDDTVQATGTTTVESGSDAAQAIAEVRNPVVVAQASVAADAVTATEKAVDEIVNEAENGSVDNAVGEEEELARAQKRFEELYPGQKAGNKKLETLQQAIKAKE